MKRTRITTHSKLNQQAEKLVQLAEATIRAGSKLEHRFWEDRLSDMVIDLIRLGFEDDLACALDHLFDNNGPAHDELADIVQACTETLDIRRQEQHFDALLVAIPILVWSRFSIPSGKIDPQTLNNLVVQLGAHTLASQTELTLCDFLFSPDHLPRSYTETLRLTETLAEAANLKINLLISAENLPEANHFLSDVRYLIGLVCAPRGQPCFRWQEEGGSREVSLKAWIRQGTPNLEHLLTGCSFQPLLIDSYHAACLQADMQARAYSLQASILFLQAVLEAEPKSLQCVIGAFYDKELEEYRISFIRDGSDQVIHGDIWPLTGNESENENDALNQIESTLNAMGIENIVILTQRFPLEFCDDCGAPLFPNLEGETVHAEFPETKETISPTLH